MVSELNYDLLWAVNPKPLIDRPFLCPSSDEGRMGPEDYRL